MGLQDTRSTLPTYKSGRIHPLIMGTAIDGVPSTKSMHLNMYEQRGAIIERMRSCAQVASDDGS